jgi:hypothetical protein
MEDVVKKDIISIITDAIRALKNKDVEVLTELSNHTIHDASIYQDEDSITIAVVVYAISKIVARNETNPVKNFNSFSFSTSDNLRNASSYLENDKTDAYRSSIKKIIKEISKIDSEVNVYITKVFEEANVKKGSKLYEHGISLEQVSELLGVSQWELMKYVGRTKIMDISKQVGDVKQRLDFARKLFA